MRSRRARVITLAGVVELIYAAYGVFSRWHVQQYLSMSGTPQEKCLMMLLCIQTVAIVYAERGDCEPDYHMLCMHICFIFNFTPLRPGHMHAITVFFGLLPFCLLTILGPLVSYPKAEDGSYTSPNIISSVVSTILKPTFALFFQVIVTMRRDESLRLDALMSQDLQKQHHRLAVEQHKIENLLSTMFPHVFLSALNWADGAHPTGFPLESR